MERGGRRHSPWGKARQIEKAVIQDGGEKHSTEYTDRGRGGGGGHGGPAGR